MIILYVLKFKNLTYLWIWQIKLQNWILYIIIFYVRNECQGGNASQNIPGYAI